MLDFKEGIYCFIPLSEPITLFQPSVSVLMSHDLSTERHPPFDN